MRGSLSVVELRIGRAAPHFLSCSKSFHFKDIFPANSFRDEHMCHYLANQPPLFRIDQNLVEILSSLPGLGML
ncbi:hypothetical protein VNO77_08314 [Canavalia gladiata]|uniref:Uncharacterized protein n=1 Tax=Canavalia gladiata TaxID=3824 RepID=A0AAN9M991_CANGL